MSLRSSTALALAIALLCAAFATVWALRVPYFESPDEIAHADYAFALYDVGRPFLVADARPNNFVTTQSRYIAEATHYRRMRYNPAARVDAGYGSRAYFRELDRGAPKPSYAVPPRGSNMPYVMFAYPFAYYAIVAGVMTIVGDATSQSISSIFFAARLTSTLFLFGTCLLMWRIFRLSGFERGVALMATLGVGSFPLVTTMAATIQPDNFAFLVSALTLYFALYFRRRPSGRNAVLLGLTCATLFFAKQHNALAFWLPSAFLAATMWRRIVGPVRPVALVAVGIAPLVALATSFLLSPVLGLSDPQRFIRETLHHAHAGQGTVLHETLTSVARKFLDLYAGGTAFWSYWLEFGVRGATYVPDRVAQPLASFLIVATIVTASAVVVLRIRIVQRIFRVGRKRSVEGALRLVAAGIAVNSYALVFGILVVLSIGAGITLQGRYMLVAIVPLVIILLQTLPRFFVRPHRRVVRHVLAGSMATCSLLLSFAGLHALDADYYEPARHSLAHDSLADVDVVTIRAIDTAASDEIAAPRNEAVTFSGHAIDMRTGLPARRIVVRVNGRDRSAAGTGEVRPDVAAVFADDLLQRSGFRITLPSSVFHRGSNDVEFRLADADDKRPLPFLRRFAVSVR